MSFLNNIFKTFLGDKAEKDVSKIRPFVAEINKIQLQFQNISNDELRNKTQNLKNIISQSRSHVDKEIKILELKIEDSNNFEDKEKLYLEIDSLEQSADQIIKKKLDEILPETFAVVKETARRFKDNSFLEVSATNFDRSLSANHDYIELRGNKAIWKNHWDAAGKPITWDMVHYDVQLIGGIALHQGKIAEMQTGEGKTLVATLPVFLNALTGKGVHLVTVNDYLAKRDSAWMAPLFQFHGLSVDCIDYYKPNSQERRDAYLADITYGTNNEFGFDYLRDNMAHRPEDLVQRKHHYSIVDEVDSVLIDDARTPLIISGPTPEGDRHEFNQLKPQVSELVSKQKTLLSGLLSEAKMKIKEGNNEEGGKILYTVFRGLPKNKALIKYLSEEGIRQLLQKNENFYMQDNNRNMHIIDAELYFVIDEKNNQIDLTEKGTELLSSKSNDSNLFILRK